MSEYIVHPLIRKEKVIRRKYQEEIAKNCLRGNTLVVIPTGLGKTIIAAIVAAERLRRHPEGKCYVLAPTRPLALQHMATFKEVLTIAEEEYTVLTGEIPPEKRSAISSRAVFLTPQVLENDLIAGRTKLSDVILLVVDEAHRAVGKYAYKFIAERYIKDSTSPLILALTASPGSTREKIEEVKGNLNITHVEARTEASYDVKPFVQPLNVEWQQVELSPEFLKIRTNLESFVRETLKAVKSSGLADLDLTGRFTFRDFAEAQKRLRIETAKYSRPPENLRIAASDLAAAKRISYAVALLETQGLAALNQYLAKLQTLGRRPGASRSVKKILSDGAVQEAMNLAFVYFEKGLEHPKLQALQGKAQELLTAGTRRIIVFTNYRETARLIVQKLRTIPGLSPTRFVGQSSREGDEGLSQKQQAQTLDEFKNGVYNVLVATQVAEEGIDVSSSDAVIFYDNVPSAIRFIQRRGRTGRSSPGRLIILLAKNTRDEAYYWIAKRKEQNMRYIIKEMEREQPNKASEEQPSLEQFIPDTAAEAKSEAVKIAIDVREGNSQVVKELLRIGTEIQLTHLTVADYILSERVACERKTVQDFAASIIDKRLFNQAKEISSAYTNPIIIVEGENLYSASGISPNALRGALIALLLDFHIPVLVTKDTAETALMLYTIARTEQVEKKTHLTIRGEKKPLTLPEQQEYVVAGLPNVELTMARRLLSHFGSVEKIFTATTEELQNVRGVGDIIAEKIRKVLSTAYEQTGAEEGG